VVPAQGARQRRTARLDGDVPADEIRARAQKGSTLRVVKARIMNGESNPILRGLGLVRDDNRTADIDAVPRIKNALSVRKRASKR
jgi:hypothetical protein